MTPVKQPSTLRSLIFSHMFFQILVLASISASPSWAKTSSTPARPQTPPECPFQRTLTTQFLGQSQFGTSNAQRVFQSLNEEFEARKSEFPHRLIQKDHREIEFESPILVLQIQPTAFRKAHSCQKYFGKHRYPKVFTAQARTEALCRAQVQKQANDWTQGTLVGSTTAFISGDTPEGDDLYEKCPGNCSYSSVQSMMFSWDGHHCQLRSVLEVTCGAPKEKNEFVARADLHHTHICELRREE